MSIHVACARERSDTVRAMSRRVGVWQVGCTRRVTRTRVRRRSVSDTLDTPFHAEIISSKSPYLQGDGVHPYEALRKLAYN